MAGRRRSEGGGPGCGLWVVGLLVVVAAVLVVLGGGLWWHTLRLASRQHPEAGVSSSRWADSAAGADEAVAAFERQLPRGEPNPAVERLAESVRFRTISHESNYAGTPPPISNIAYHFL